MKRLLRHPIRSITEPYGKAGLMVAILALALATTGAAFAAAGLNGKQKKEVTAIAKKYAGKPGANGTNGTNGTNGAPGEKGAKGDPGAPGEAGKSVVSHEFSGAHAGCSESRGGSEFEVEGSGTKTYVCNGKNGTTGFTETLPTGETETGTWAASGLGTEYEGLADFVLAPISFSIPLEAEGVQAHFIEAGAINPTGCSGNAANPGAAPGNLCVFGGNTHVQVNSGHITPPNLSLIEGGEITPEESGTTGATLWLASGSATEGMLVQGSWAVTAE